jgi:hypothetical protein
VTSRPTAALSVTAFDRAADRVGVRRHTRTTAVVGRRDRRVLHARERRPRDGDVLYFNADGVSQDVFDATRGHHEVRHSTRGYSHRGLHYAVPLRVEHQPPP